MTGGLDLVSQPDGDRLRRTCEDRVVHLVEPELVLEGPWTAPSGDELGAAVNARQAR